MGCSTLSYTDAIHLATALMADCDVLYTGDPIFKDIDEIENVVIPC
ncbi:MAG: PIN domain-containing protein [Thermoplasmata archaeon]